MAFTSAYIAQARLNNLPLRHLHPQDMMRVRKLYLDKRFKNCITACEELLKTPPTSPAIPSHCTGASSTELHPVHQAFLIFHQAISHECLGTVAHKFSQNKIKFFKLAKDQFKAALNKLPQPFANAHDGAYQTPRTSSPDMHVVGNHSDTSYYLRMTAQPHRVMSETPSDRLSDANRSPSDESLDSMTSGTAMSATNSVSRASICDKNMQIHRQTHSRDWSPKDLPQSLPQVEVEIADESSSDDDGMDRVSTWLPRSMRSLNLAALTLGSDSDDNASEGDRERTPLSSCTLISTPIDGMHGTMSNSSSHNSRLSARLSSQHMLCQDLVPSPLFSKTRKLPKISRDGTSERDTAPHPFSRTAHSHLPQLPLLPVRKTAVQTLISKFEGKLPFPDTPSSQATATPPASLASHAIDSTPIASRFDTIRNAVDRSPDQTPLNAYLTSRSLARFNSNLAAFRTCLLSAHEHVEDMLEAAQAIQQKHDDDKRAAEIKDDESGMPKKRLASLWLLSTPGKPNGLRQGLDGNSAPDSMTRTQITEGSAALRSRKQLRLHNRIEESQEKRAARIKQLRQNGFKVHKERHGWRGEGYYESFRRKMEIDLVA